MLCIYSNPGSGVGMDIYGNNKNASLKHGKCFKLSYLSRDDNIVVTSVVDLKKIRFAVCNHGTEVVMAACSHA